MPLKKSPSKEAFRQNVKAEVKAGKPVKQAVAIAYSVKKNAKTNQHARHGFRIGAGRPHQ
jgi:hypothetical protein